MKQLTALIKLGHPPRHEPYTYRGNLAWGCGRQYGRWPLDLHEREIVRVKGHIPCDTTPQWSTNLTTFAFGNIDKQYFNSTCDALLEYSLISIRSALSKRIGVWDLIADARKALVVDIAYKNGTDFVSGSASLLRAIDENAWRRIHDEIMRDASNAGEYQGPCNTNPFGSRGYYLSQMALTGQWPEWAK